MEILFGDTIIFSHVAPLGKLGRALACFQKFAGAIDPIMFKIGNIKHIIATVAVGLHDTIRPDFIGYYRNERVRPCVGYRQSEDLTTVFQ